MTEERLPGPATEPSGQTLVLGLVVISALMYALPLSLAFGPAGPAGLGVVLLAVAGLVRTDPAERVVRWLVGAFGVLGVALGVLLLPWG